MERQTHTGWRALAPGLVQAVPKFDEAKKDKLYECQRLAERAMELKAGPRAVLNALVGVYGGEPIGGRLIVWPSNDMLVTRTGLSERAVRLCIRQLIDLGLLRSKDSANGKRFAIRSTRGQIIDAYGLDLSPLLEGAEEFEQRVEEQKIERDRRSRLFDQITVCKRAVRQVVATLGEHHPDVDAHGLQETFQNLEDATPRRSPQTSPDAFLVDWEKLRAHAESIYLTASAGKNRRHIDTDSNAPDQSCQRAQEWNEGGETEFTMADIGAACPDAFAYVNGSIRTFADLAAEAGKLRGGFGTHRSAWEEAGAKIGPAAAGVTFFMVLQLYCDSEAGRGPRISNFGGYFRSLVRMIAENKIELAEEIRRLKRRRAN